MPIAGDIGGTKTDVAIYSSEAGSRSPLAPTEVRYGLEFYRDSSEVAV
jgi:hypothetical protein